MGGMLFQTTALFDFCPDTGEQYNQIKCRHIMFLILLSHVKTTDLDIYTKYSLETT